MPTLTDTAHTILLEAQRLTQAAIDAQREHHIQLLTKRWAAVFRKQGRLFLDMFPKFASWFLNAEFGESAISGDLDEAFSEIFGVTQAQAQDMMAQSMIEGLNVGYAAQASNFGLEASFKLPPEQAQRWARANAAARVSKIDDTTKKVIHDMCVKGIDEGKSYGEVAREIKKRFNEFAVGSPLENISSRAELVAVTENAFAFENGQKALVDQIQQVGIKMEKAWEGPDDDKTSEECRANMQDGWIPADAAFSSGDETPPSHPGCRHYATYRIAEG